MTVQPMTLDLNSLRAPQTSNNQQVSGKKDDFSSVLERSREKQEEPSKQRINREKEKVVETPKDKVTSDAQEPVTKEPATKEVSKTEKTTPEDVLAKEKSDKVTQAIADLLNITVNELEQMLATLQIGISDLLKGDHLQQLIMQVHGVSEPMELLLIPEVAGEVKAISSMLEDTLGSTQVAKPDPALLKVLPELTEASAQVEPEVSKVKPEVQVAAGNNQKNTEEAPKANAENVSIKTNAEIAPKINLANPSDQNLSQNKEQAAPNQNNAANQFLDHLTQSMGDVFQTQNNPVNETFETVATRNEVINPRMVLDQIVEKIKVSSLENEAKMNIQLKPEHLGKLSMEVISKNGIMTAHITVENEKTRAMLEQNIQNLRDSLEGKGLVIQALEVAVGQNQNEANQAYEGQKSKRNISDIIQDMMNEDLAQEEVKSDNLFEDDTNEVDFIA